jgi:hypothetical protein
MTNLATDSSQTQRSKRRYPHGAPRDPTKVFTIIDLRDKKHCTWREISQILQMSRQGPFLLYQRWKIWAEEYCDEQKGTG